MFTRQPPLSSGDILEDLQRLIEAIDSRVPRPERPAEAAIARDAALLRQRAVALMRDLKAQAGA